MAEGERRVDKSDVGDPPSASAPAQVLSSTTESTAQGVEATSISVSSLSLADKVESPQLADKVESPQSKNTLSTLEADTTVTESELSSERGNDEGATEQIRQVIAVSVSKSPSAFFNLARKFLITDEECDLSALEGAIVSAVDAAHLLERSKIGTIVR